MNKYEEAFHVVSMGDSFPGAEEQFEKGLEVLRDLVKKETPKKAIALRKYIAKGGNNKYFRHAMYCPTCYSYLGIIADGDTDNPYCPKCGQKVKWRDDDL